MKLLTLYTPVLLTALFLGACQQPLLKNDQSTTATDNSAPQPLPFTSSFKPPQQLSEDAIHHYLAAEIAIQRQQLDLAYEQFMLAAAIVHDPVATEKATRIALLQKNSKDAQLAVSRWIDYDPNSIQARQLSGILYLRDADLQSAQQQFEALLKISNSQGSDGFLRIASLLASEKDKQNNLLLMQALTAGHPHSAEANYALALVQFEAQLLSQAELSIKQSKALAPSWDKPYVLEAQILASQGDNEAAEKSLAKAVKRLPRERSLLQAYGRILVENQKYKKAIKVFRKAYDLDPSDLDMLYAVGMLAMQAEEWDTARDSWTNLLGSDSREKRNDAYYFLGQVEELDNHPQQAITYYQSVGKGSSHTEARLRLARLLAKSGRLEEAQSIYAELRVLNNSLAIQIYAAEAQTLKEIGKTEAALQLYSTAVRAYPENMDLRYARGLYAADQGKIDLAISDFEHILAIEPDNADTLNALGYTLADQTDRYQEALQYIAAAHQLKPDNAAILDSMGWVLYRLGKYQKSLKYLHKAAIANPDAEIAAHLGEVLWVLGNHSEAKKVWNEALIIEPDSEKLKEVMQRLQ